MVDYSDNELDSRIEGMLAPDCHPTHFNITADFDKIVGKAKEEIEALNLTKYYTSELIGIKSDENPPFNVLTQSKAEMTKEEKTQFTDFGNKIIRLIRADDACDTNGIKFLAKLFLNYNDNQEQSKNPNIQNYVSGISSYKAKIVDMAKEVTNKLGR